MIATIEAPVSRSGGPAAVGSDLGWVMRGLRDRNLDDPANLPPESDEAAHPELDEGYAEVRRQAWLNSLRLADHSHYNEWTLDQLDDEQHPGRLKNWVTAASLAKRKKVRPKALNGIAYGNTGSGKTTAIVAAGRYAVESGLRTRYLKHTHYLQWLRPNGAPAGYTDKEIVRLFTEIDLLVLDEVCGELDNASDWVREKSADLIDARVAAGRPTLCSTNLPSRRIAEIMGSRFLSRLAGGASRFEIVGEDRRMPVSWGDTPETEGTGWG
ncbi:ATP-binding protein [Streptomyces tendae]|uniref:ATP-binding protein n=1 Tax=Streptomyces tendae TaxID=1932 RepID=UPI00371D4205